jgi:Tfp pilus assembly protein PilF
MIFSRYCLDVDDIVRAKVKVRYPAHYGAQDNLGLAFRRQNRENDAVTEFRRVLMVDEQFRPAREALGLAGNLPN